MILIISPSKTQDFSKTDITWHSKPRQFKNSLELVSELKKYSEEQIAKLMNLSPKLAQLNYLRLQNFQNKCDLKNAKQAILAFKGDVYQGFDIVDYNEDDFTFAQDNLRIISGLYGVIRPLDLIQPYRLEMSTALKNSIGNNLYKFWEQKISPVLNDDEQNIIINLASQEYSKAINKKNLKAKILTIDFKETKNGAFKTIGIFAKRARGAMANYIIKNRINNINEIKKFNEADYKFKQELSQSDVLVFAR